MTTKLVAAFFLAVIIALEAWWQFTKFNDGRGLFFMISRRNGDVLLTAQIACAVIAFGIIVFREPKPGAGKGNKRGS